jgi:hypothetical protein
MGTEWIEWQESGKRPDAAAWQDFEDRISLLELGGGPGGGGLVYVEDVGNGTDVNFTVTHDLDSEDVSVDVVNNMTDERVWAGVESDGPDDVVVSFALPPGTNQFRVIVRN